MSDNINVTPSFVLAGEATFTVSNGDGRHYTYHVYKSKPAPGFLVSRWFIKLLTGPDHTDIGKGYTYMGMLWWPRESGWNKAEFDNTHHIPTVKLTARSRKLTDDTSLRVARWALRAIWQAANDGYKVPARMSIQHAGRCGRCGAVLTNPASLDTGLGPECAEKVGIEHREKNHAQRELPNVAGPEYTPNQRRTKQNPGPDRRKGPRTLHIIDEHTSARDYTLAKVDLMNFFDPSKHHNID